MADYSPVVDAVLGQDVQMIAPSCLALSAEGSAEESAYGVQCMLHLHGSLTSVTVSRIVTSPDTVDEDTIERAKQRVRALRACPHERIAPPLALALVPEVGGGQSLLAIERMPSSSSLQSMILYQMERPKAVAYSWKSGMEWLRQIALALAHIHELQPDAPHGRLSSRTIFVTSANDIAVGRALSAASIGDLELAPVPKRHQPSSPQSRSTMSGGSRPSLSHPSPPRPGALLRAVRVSDDGSGARSAHVTLMEAVHMASSHCAPSQGDPLDSDPSDSQSSGRGEPSSGTYGPGMSVTGRCKSRMMHSASGRAPFDESPSASISSAELPGVGRVTKVSIPKQASRAMRANSLHDAAEAAVWLRTDAGTEVKQHGGSFFSLGIKAQHLSQTAPVGGSMLDASPTPDASESAPLATAAPALSAPLSSSAPRDVPACGAPPAFRVADLESSLRSELDAADTEHVLLSGSMIWHPQRSSDGAADAHDPFLEPAGATSAAWLPPFRRAVSRSYSESATVRRHSGDAPVPAPTFKRTRSGLSHRLPSLVELPAAEAACNADPSGHFAHASGHKPTSMPGAWGEGVGGDAAARTCAEDAARFSTSSPGLPVRSHADSGDSADAVASASAALVRELDRARHAPPALRLVRAAMCKAHFGRSLSHLSFDNTTTGLPRTRSAGSSSPSTPGAAALGSLDAGTESKRHGSQALLQILELQDADSRQEWLELMQRAGSARVASAAEEQARLPDNGRRLEDVPYLAPELLSGGEAGHAADVYAFGTLMYEVLKQELVVADVAVRADLGAQSDADALSEYAQSVVEGERPLVPISWPRPVRELIQRCWNSDPFARPTMPLVLHALSPAQLSSFSARSNGL